MHDSPLEEAGFEPSVPRRMEDAFEELCHQRDVVSIASTLRAAKSTPRASVSPIARPCNVRSITQACKDISSPKEQRLGSWLSPLRGYVGLEIIGKLAWITEVGRRGWAGL